MPAVRGRGRLRGALGVCGAAALPQGPPLRPAQRQVGVWGGDLGLRGLGLCVLRTAPSPSSAAGGGVGGGSRA